MKNTAKLLIIPFAILMIFCGCSKQADNTFEALGNTYEECDKSWHPYGNRTTKDGFVAFDNDKNDIFIGESNALFYEDVIYHRADDVYPSVSQIDRIERIVLTDGEKKITLDKEFVSSMAEILTFSKIDSSEIIMLDYGKDFFFINVYYKDYPVYQNECMITVSNDGEPVIAFCETEKNAQILGEGKALTINDDELSEYLRRALR